MKLSSFALAGMVLLSSGSYAQQVYKTTDAEGNTVFTDMPPTKEAETVNLSSPNIADSVEVRPPPEPTEKPSPAPAPQAPGDPMYVGGGNDNLREEVYEERRQRELRERARDADGQPSQLPSVQPAPKPAPRRAAPRGK